MRPRRRLHPAFLALCLAATALAGLSHAAPDAAAQLPPLPPVPPLPSLPTLEPCSWPSDGQWVLGTGVDMECKGTDITIQNLTVELGGILTLKDCKIHLDSKADPDTPHHGYFGYNIHTGGQLHAQNCVFDSVNSQNRWQMQVLDGILDLQQNTFHDLRDIGIAPNDLGATIIGNTFPDGIGFVGISVFGSNAQISDNLFIGSDYGIIAQGSPTITGNTFAGCVSGIDIQSLSGAAAPKIADNTFSGCSIGLEESIGSNPQALHNNDFSDNWNRNPNAVGNRFAQIVVAGNATENWWGENQPNAKNILGAGSPPPTIDPWLTSPAHPERLPSISLGSIPPNVPRHQSVAFTASALPSSKFGYSIKEYAWDLGDGTHLSGNKVNHAYTTPGTYTVRLVVRDTIGLARIAQVPVTVTSPHSG